MSRAQNAIFPEANVNISQPDWMRDHSPAVRPADFSGNQDPRMRPAAPEENARPEPKPDPLAAERAELAAQSEALAAERAALDHAREELERAQEIVADAAAAVSDAVDRHRAEVGSQLAEIAVAVARALVVDAFDEAPERAASLVEAAMSHIDGDGIRLRVGAALHIALLESGAQGSAELDASLPPFGCIAENQGTRVLAGLEDRLGEVLSALREVT